MVNVRDTGGGLGAGAALTSPNTKITIDVTQIDDDPTLAANNPLTVTGASTTVITNSFLGVNDIDSPPENLVYTLNSRPTQGVLQVNVGGTWFNLGIGGLFTQEQINNGQVRYVHEVNGGTTDSFNFVVRDSVIRSVFPLPNEEGGIRTAPGQPLQVNTFNLVINNPNLATGTTPSNPSQGYGGTSGTPGSNSPQPDPTVQLTNNNLANPPREGGTGLITNAMLNYKFVNAGVVDIPADQTIYTVTSLPPNGSLEKLIAGVWTVIPQDGSFSQQDINDGSIRFRQDGGERFLSSFSYSVTAGGENRISSTFNLNTIPVNDAPTVAQGNAIILPEGGVRTLTTAQVKIEDVDGVNSDKNTGFAAVNTLDFQVTALPTHGTLFRDLNSNNRVDPGEAIALNQWITKTDLVNGQIKYLHDGTENFLDQLTVKARDNWGAESATANIKIDIVTVNDTPQIALLPTDPDPVVVPLPGEVGSSKNDPLTVNEGAEGVITNLLLQAVDPDDNTIQRQYRVTSRPQFGTLLLNGQALGVGSTFTQDDIDNGRLSYKHNGSENFADFFNFVVSDGDRTTPVARFETNIIPLNDTPTLTTATTNFYLGSTNPLAITGIRIFDTDLSNIAPGERDLIRVTLDPQLNGVTYPQGKLNLVTTTGITFIAGTNNRLGNKLVIEGTIAAVSAAIASLTYQINNDLNQTIKLNVTVDDRLRNGGGNVNGANGGLTNQNGTPLNETNNTATKIININASITNNPPSFVNIPNNLTVNEDTSLNLSGAITVTDPDTFDLTNNTVTVSVANGKIGITNPSLITGGSNNSNSFTLTGSFSAINTALNGLSYKGNQDFNGTDTLTITATDSGSVGQGGINTVTETRPIVVVPVNDPPALVVPGTQTIKTANPLIFSGANTNRITIDDLADLNNNGTDNFSVTLRTTRTDNNSLFGTLTAVNSGAVITGSGSSITLQGTKAQINAALNGLTFTPDNYNTDVPINLAVTVNDNANGGTAIGGIGGNLTVTQNIKITLSDLNNAPSFANLDTISSNGYIENNPGIVLDNNVTVTDPELANLFNNWNGAILTLNRRGGANPEDIFGATGSLGLVGNSFQVGGVTIGTFTNSNGTLNITFNSNATNSLVNSALQQITYRNSSEKPPTSVTIDYTINDGNTGLQGFSSPLALKGFASTQINITPRADAPVIGFGVANPIYVENTPAIIVDNGFILTDVDDTQMVSATVDIETGFKPGDVLAVTTTGTAITASYDGNGTLFLTGTDTKEHYQQVLRSLTFINPGEDPTNTQRVLRYSVTDANSDKAGAATGTATRNVTVIPINDAPVLTATGQNSNYVEDTVAFTSLFTGATSTTIEAGQTISQLRFTVSNVTDGAAETLNINGSTVSLINGATFTGGGLSGSVSLSGSTATVTINGSASATAIAALVNGLGYKNTSQAPTAGTRTITITSITDNGGTANGGINTSNPNLIATVNIIPVNDAPLLTPVSPILASTEDNPAPVGAVGSLVSSLVGGITDVDGATVPNGIAITNITSQGTLYYSLNNGATWIAIAAGSLSNTKALLLPNNSNTRLYFRPTPNLNGTVATGLTFRAWDRTSGKSGTRVDTSVNGGVTAFSANTDTISIPISPVNDAPIASGSSTLLAIPEDTVNPSGATVGNLFTPNFSDLTDQVVGGSSANKLAGVAIVGNTSNPLTQGKWQYFNGKVWTDVGTRAENNALILDSTSRLRFLPIPNYNGPASTLTVHLIDDSSGPVTRGTIADLSPVGAIGGTTVYSQGTVPLTTNVIPVNDPPTLVAPGPQTLDNGVNVTFSTAKGNPITIDDLADLNNNGLDIFTLTLTVTNGANPYGNLTLATQTGLTVTGNGTSTVNLSGTKAQINAALNGLVYTPPNANADFTVNLNVVVNDLGNGSPTIGLNPLTAQKNIPINLSNINNPPVLTKPLAVAATEDTPFSFGNAIAINDPDDFGKDLLVTLAVTKGGLSLGNLAGLSFTVGDGTGDATMTFKGTETAINNALNGLSYLGNTNYNTVGTSKDVLTVTVNDLGNTGAIAGVVGVPNTLTQTVNITVAPVNDAPIALNDVTLAAVNEDTLSPPGATVGTLLTRQFSDVADQVTGGSRANTFTGIAIIGNTANPLTEGKWQYNVGTQWLDIPPDSDPSPLGDSNAITLLPTTKLRFLPVSNYSGTPGNLKVRVIDSSGASGAIANAARGVNVTNNGGATAISGNAVLVKTTVNPVNDPPVIHELDGDFLNYPSGSGPTIIDQLTPTAQTFITDTEGIKTGGVLTITPSAVVGLTQTGNTLGFKVGAGSPVTITDTNANGIQEVRIGGLEIGTIDPAKNGQNGTPLVITFNGNVTNDLSSVLLQNITYQYNGPQTGITSLVFQVTDGQGGVSNQPLVDINVNSTGTSYSAIYPGGTDRADTIFGNQNVPTKEVIHGRGANDTLYGYGEDDILFGDKDNDRLFGGEGNDVLVGGQGIDDLKGENGNDTLLGGTENDVLSGGLGDDFISGGVGQDRLTGDLGADRFDYRNLPDSLLRLTSAPLYDKITDFTIGTDLLVVSTQPTVFNNFGAIARLDSASIAAKLTATTFVAGSAGLFTVGRQTFIAINDTTAGYEFAKDGIIEVTGFKGGSFSLASFMVM